MVDTVIFYRQAYSKLIMGDDPDGPIVARTEHQITSRSRDYPPGVGQFGKPAYFFEDWSGVSVAVASEWANHGAFLYHVVQAKSGIPYCIFARLQPRSEGGKNGSGRKFTHSVSLACELDNWRPGMILAVYDLLFPSAKDGSKSTFGEPDVVAVPEEERMSSQKVEIPVDEIAKLESDNGAPKFWRIKQEESDKRFVIGADFPDQPTQREVVADCAAFLHHQSDNFPVELMSFAIGIAYGAVGSGPGFALSAYAVGSKVTTAKTKFSTLDGGPIPKQFDLSANFKKGRLDWQSVFNSDMHGTPPEQQPTAEVPDEGTPAADDPDKKVNVDPYKDQAHIFPEPTSSSEWNGYPDADDAAPREIQNESEHATPALLHPLNPEQIPDANIPEHKVEPQPHIDPVYQEAINHRDDFFATFASDPSESETEEDFEFYDERHDQTYVTQSTVAPIEYAQKEKGPVSESKPPNTDNWSEALSELDQLARTLSRSDPPALKATMAFYKRHFDIPAAVFLDPDNAPGKSKTILELRKKALLIMSFRPGEEKQTLEREWAYAVFDLVEELAKLFNSEKTDRKRLFELVLLIGFDGYHVVDTWYFGSLGICCEALQKNRAWLRQKIEETKVENDRATDQLEFYTELHILVGWIIKQPKIADTRNANDNCASFASALAKYWFSRSLGINDNEASSQL